ncbi:hypothetical protein HDR58_05460 [bacterium]|nr:hypothetical protein [bacterium]
MQRIPLEQRLQNAAIAKSGCPAACWLYAGTYFYTLAELSADTHYQSFYQYAVMNDSYGGIEDSFIARIVSEALAGAFPSGVTELLYEILIRPFTDNYIWEDRR